MRVPSGIAVAVLGAALAGCGASPPEPAPTPSAPPPCTPDTGTVAWDGMTSTPSLLHVVARYLDGGRTTWRDLRDQPYTPSVSGGGADRSWIPALARSLGELHNVSLGEGTSPATELEKLHEMLEGSTRPGWVLGYSGTTLVEAGFRVTCGAEPPISGRLTTWNSLDSGFVACADQAARGEPTGYPDIWTFCPTD